MPAQTLRRASGPSSSLFRGSAARIQEEKGRLLPARCSPCHREPSRTNMPIVKRARIGRQAELPGQGRKARNSEHDQNDGYDLRLSGAHAQYVKNGIDSDALDQKPLRSAKQKIERKEPARPERVLAHAPEYREASERHKRLEDGRGVHPGRWDRHADDIVVVGLRPEPNGDPVGLDCHVRPYAPVAVPRELATYSSDRVSEHQRRSDGVAHDTNRKPAPLDVNCACDRAEDQPSKDAETAARKDHLPRTGREFARVLEEVKDAGTDDADDHDDRAEFADDPLGRYELFDAPPVPALDAALGQADQAGFVKPLELSARDPDRDQKRR